MDLGVVLTTDEVADLAKFTGSAYTRRAKVRDLVWAGHITPISTESPRMVDWRFPTNQVLQYLGHAAA
jgi:hypothetical protein